MASDSSSLITVEGDGYHTATEDNDSIVKVESEADNKTQNEAKVKFSTEVESDDDDVVDASELTVFIPKSPVAVSHTPRVPHQTSFVKQTRARRKALILEKEKSQTFKILCGIITLLIMYGVGAAMISLALIFDIDDLFIIAGMFIAGGGVFTIVFIYLRCSVVQSYEDQDEDEEFSILKALQLGRKSSAPTFEVSD